jgi:response regulator NasT
MQSFKVLIADDDAVVRMDLRAMLESIGHCVVGEADNGETACYLARSLHPDVIMLDVMMPRMTGLEAAEIISRERLGPVLLLTAYSDLVMIEQANRAGVLAYLVKPYRQQDLLPAMTVAMGRYREMLALEGALEVAQEQLEVNRLMGKAKKVLVQRYNLTDQEAYRRLQAQALASRRSVRDICEAILLTDEITLPTGKR